MKYTKWIVALLVAMLVIALPLQAMAAPQDSVIPEDGDISIEIPGGNTEPAEYVIVFKNEDGTVLSEATYKYGDTVTAPAEAPTKAEDEVGTYVFAGWDKEVTACIGNAVYTATYTVTYKEYTVTFQDEGGYVYETQTLHWGDAINAPIPDNRDINEYEFLGWTPEMTETCQGNATYTAQWKKLESVKNGWQLENDVWYFYENGVKVTNAWREDSMGWCWLTADGSMAVHTFIQDSVGMAYVDQGGYFKEITKWVDIGGTWYYVEDGYSIRNAWRKDSIGWCWLTEDGSMAVNTFVKDSVGMAYVDEGGYFYDNVNGWKLVNNVWYFLEGGYSVRNDWRKDSVGWCWLTEDGSMATHTFIKDSVGMAYVDGSGYFYEITKWVQIDGTWYYVEKGYSVRNDWRKDSIGWCWLTEDGSMATHTFVKDSVGMAYVDESGYFYEITKTVVIDGTPYNVVNGYLAD